MQKSLKRNTPDFQRIRSKVKGEEYIDCICLRIVENKKNIYQILFIVATALYADRQYSAHNPSTTYLSDK